MTKHDHIACWAIILFIACTFYTVLMDYFLVYVSCLLIGEKEFVSYHALLDKRIMPLSI